MLEVKGHLASMAGAAAAVIHARLPERNIDFFKAMPGRCRGGCASCRNRLCHDPVACRDKPGRPAFMLTAASVGTAEIEPGQRAVQQSTDPAVRSFAARNTPAGIEHLRIAQSMLR
jgi:hypothetical protein